MKFLLFTLLLSVSMAVQSQLTTDFILIEQHYRAFQYHQPAGNIKDGSLLFIMHGSGGSGSDMLKHTKKLEARSAADKLLLVYPDGYQHYWNECRKFSTAVANKENINENAFFSEMIKYFQKKFGISKKKFMLQVSQAAGKWLTNWGLPCQGR